MSDETVGVAELRQNLSKHLKRVRSGHRIVVTDHNRPVATLGPPPGSESALDRLIAEGRATPAERSQGRLKPVKLEGLAPNAVSRALEEMRAEER